MCDGEGEKKRELSACLFAAGIFDADEKCVFSLPGIGDCAIMKVSTGNLY